jgi:Protein of unknown function (DUF2586)
MALPDVTITIQDGALGQVPASVANAQAKVGICSAGIVGTVYSFSDIGVAQQTLGQGPLVDAIAHTLSVAGGPVYAIPANPSAVGVASAVTHTGPGSGTVTAATAALSPAQTVALKIVTGGTNGTMTFQVSLGGGAYGAVTASVGGTFAYLVPGTLTTVTFAAATTWQTTDVYTVDTLGGITLTGAGPAASNVTQVSSPLDAYSVIVTITTAGALGTAVFTYSVDGGNSVSGQIATPTGAGKYAIANTGVVMTFAGTFTAGDTYSWTTTAAGFSTSDLTTSLTALRANVAEWGFVHVVATWANAAGAAAASAIVDTQMSTAETQFRYVFGAVECPTTESDSTVATAFASFASARVMVCAGDVGAVSPINGRILRRNCAWIVTAHLAGIQAGEDAAFVGSRNPIKNVASLYRDEAKTPFLDAQRFTTMRTFPGRAGYYITNGNMMAAGGSDFNLVQRRRVMDVACRITRQAELPYLNGSVRINPTNGTIDERDAQAFEAKVNSQLKSGVVATGDASSSSVVVNRSANILSTSTLPVTVRITPLGYMKFISNNIGFTNPAITP